MEHPDVVDLFGALATLTGRTPYDADLGTRAAAEARWLVALGDLSRDQVRDAVRAWRDQDGTAEWPTSDRLRALAPPREGREDSGQGWHEQRRAEAAQPAATSSFGLPPTIVAMDQALTEGAPNWLARADELLADAEWVAAVEWVQA